MGATTLDLTFARGDQGAEQLQAVIDEVLAELGDPSSEAADAARAADLNPDDVSGAAVEVREGGQGAEPLLTTIVVGIAIHAGSKIAESLWLEVLWPRLRRRLGTRAVGEARSRSVQGEES
jgi:hypothetical protein